MCTPDSKHWNRTIFHLCRRGHAATQGHWPLATGHWRSLDTLTKVIGGLRIDFSTLLVTFEGRELGTDRELLAMTRSLTPAELATAPRVG